MEQHKHKIVVEVGARRNRGRIHWSYYKLQYHEHEHQTRKTRTADTMRQRKKDCEGKKESTLTLPLCYGSVVRCILEKAIFSSIRCSPLCEEQIKYFALNCPKCNINQLCRRTELSLGFEWSVSVIIQLKHYDLKAGRRTASLVGACSACSVATSSGSNVSGSKYGRSCNLESRAAMGFGMCTTVPHILPVDLAIDCNYTLIVSWEEKRNIKETDTSSIAPAGNSE
ncbi:hypothetical protein CBL_10506 [Carabus blaptoides fortunei]